MAIKSIFYSKNTCKFYFYRWFEFKSQFHSIKSYILSTYFIFLSKTVKIFSEFNIFYSLKRLFQNTVEIFKNILAFCVNICIFDSKSTAILIFTKILQKVKAGY
jgi:hypothetical protein